MPPIDRRGLQIVMQYNLEEKHLRSLWQKFVEMDIDMNGFWTISECYRLVAEPRTSMLAPILDALFKMADRANDGTLSFDDFLVSMTSFCSLNKEEVLQFMFIVVDEDRNGYITKEELLEFFSYKGPGGVNQAPVFPVNNKNALDLFQNGSWKRLYFDEFANLSELFPYVAYPAFQLQKMMRDALLGRRFWDKWDEERLRVFYMEAESKSMTVQKRAPDGTMITVHKPGRFTMKEILEYSRRKSMTHKGKKVPRPMEEAQIEGSVTAERDEQISRTPLLNILRNPHAAYHVPYAQPFLRKPDMDGDVTSDEDPSDINDAAESDFTDSEEEERREQEAKQEEAKRAALSLEDED